ncbi:unnamed protein product [Pieris brassicae]|uniref:Uncharacterized protein n=1 Tax=Pieris brassicae TaxID=7116 RepID=A0A9P0TBX1_PIEBR|nr:unnamed protein product [Pieris brassicae]
MAGDARTLPLRLSRFPPPPHPTLTAIHNRYCGCETKVDSWFCVNTSSPFENCDLQLLVYNSCLRAKIRLCKKLVVSGCLYRLNGILLKYRY